MNDPFDLTSRHALVTGATRGIGLAIAQTLAARGASVTITGRKADTIADALRTLPGGEGRACHQGDR